MAYDTQHQDISEQIIRIYTSSWMRRLWTLQEGALAQSLCFQFADKSVNSLALIHQVFQAQKGGSVRHRIIWQDAWKEFSGIASFFSETLSPTITHLDEALKYRSVSVSTDEPLCIGTLMSLDLPAILAVKAESDRMQKVWELIAEKVGGIPSQAIFFEEPRISFPGWRWAPQSLLVLNRGIHDFTSRMLRWSAPQLGSITSRGLRVQYPGYRLSAISEYSDGKPRNPWPGFERIPESYVEFRDSTTGNWFRIVDKRHAFINQHQSEEEKKASNKLSLFPLHDIINTDKSIIILNSIGKVLEGLLATTVENKAKDDGIPVKTDRFIMLSALQPDEGHIYDTVRRLALQLRSDAMTSQHLELYHRLVHELDQETQSLKENEEFKASIKMLKEKMKDMMKEVVDNDQKFVAAVTTNLGSDFLDYVWVLIYEFFHHDYVGEKIEADQVWYVD